MFNSIEHPSLCPNTSGKARRHVICTRIIRPVRLDHQTDDALHWLRSHLAIPHDCKDLASVSMVCRRALRLYHLQLARVVNDPAILDKERQAVRALTQPGGRKKKKAKPTTP